MHIRRFRHICKCIQCLKRGIEHPRCAWEKGLGMKRIIALALVLLLLLSLIACVKDNGELPDVGEQGGGNDVGNTIGGGNSTGSGTGACLNNKYHIDRNSDFLCDDCSTDLTGGYVDRDGVTHGPLMPVS